MENRVGDKVPSEDEIKKLVHDISAIRDRIAKFGVALTPEERVTALKPRMGFEAVVRTVASLAAEHGLVMPNIDVADMKADLDLSTRLGPLVTATAQLNQLVDDTLLEAKHETWWAATAFYTSLVRSAGTSGPLHDALQPLVQFFAIGKRAKAAPVQK